jgi:hypothetical protein
MTEKSGEVLPEEDTAMGAGKFTPFFGGSGQARRQDRTNRKPR